MYRSIDDEKLKLTPQKINQDLKRKVMQLEFGPVMAYAMFLTMGVVIILSLFLGFGYRLPPLVKIIVSLLLLIGEVVVIAYLYKRYAARYFAWVKAGKYHVVKATLSSMALHGSRGTYWFLSAPRIPFDNALYFGSFEPYYADPTELTRTAEGDEYWLVIFDEEPNRPRTIYRVDTYSWRG